MRRKAKPFRSALYVLIGLMLLLAACSSSKNNTAGSPSAPDSSAPAESGAAPESSQPAESSAAPLEKVTLKFVLLGEAPKDNDAVMAEVNKKLEADINATIELTYIPFADINTKYPLVLASPQDWDVIFGNVNYGSNASKGGYREITPDDVNKYMPLTAQATTDAMWADARVDGKIYMIPQTFKELDVGTGFYREDLRKKYNVPEIKQFSDLGPYFQAIKDNEKGMPPVDGSASDIQGIFGGLMKNYVGKEAPYITGFFPDDPNYTITGLFDDAFKEKFVAAAKIMKDWADKGYFPKNAFSQKTAAADLAKEGKYGYWANAFEKLCAIQLRHDRPKAGSLRRQQFDRQRRRHDAPRTVQRVLNLAEDQKLRASLMAIDLLHRTNRTTCCWRSASKSRTNTINGDGKLVVVQSDPNPYPMYGAGCGPTTSDQWPPLESYTQQYIDTRRRCGKSRPYLLNGSNVDTTNIRPSWPTLRNIDKQYSAPIQMGLVKDVDAAVADLIERFKKAGAEKVVEKSKKQAAAFVASKQTK